MDPLTMSLMCKGLAAPESYFYAHSNLDEDGDYVDNYPSDDGMGVDGEGNIYTLHNPQFAVYAATLIKQSPTGTTLWSRRFPDYTSASTLEVDAEGNIYVAYDSLNLCKINSSGTLLWSRRYPSGSGGSMRKKIAILTSGNIAFSFGQSTSVLKLMLISPSGNLIAQTGYDVGGFPQASSLSESSDGGVFLAFQNRIIKYDSNLSFLWARGVQNSVIKLVSNGAGGCFAACGGTVIHVSSSGTYTWHTGVAGFSSGRVDGIAFDGTDLLLAGSAYSAPDYYAAFRLCNATTPTTSTWNRYYSTYRASIVYRQCRIRGSTFYVSWPRLDVKNDGTTDYSIYVTNKLPLSGAYPSGLGGTYSSGGISLSNTTHSIVTHSNSAAGTTRTSEADSIALSVGENYYNTLNTGTL